MKKLGIIQPGRIGDIIICLPIAKWYADKGYDVVWPIEQGYVSNFAAYIDYVTFVGIDSLDCNVARKECIPTCNNILDLSITFPNSHPYNDSLFYQHRNEMSFDQLKYAIASVPFEEKWNFSFKRNHQKELDIYNSLNLRPDVPYTFVHNQGSSEFFKYPPGADEEVVIADQRALSIFDWLYVIERASKIICIDSCFSNLIEQSNVSACDKFLVRRAADVRPVYKNWTVL
jgi:hypothetical protein